MPRRARSRASRSPRTSACRPIRRAFAPCCAPPSRPSRSARERGSRPRRRKLPERTETYTGFVEGSSTRLRLRVSPGADRAAIAGRLGEAWKVRVTAPAEGGRANEAVIRLLAEALSLPPEAVTLVSGHGARDKIVQLAGLDPTQIERRLSSAAGKEQGK